LKSSLIASLGWLIWVGLRLSLLVVAWVLRFDGMETLIWILIAFSHKILLNLLFKFAFEEVSNVYGYDEKNEDNDAKCVLGACSYLSICVKVVIRPVIQRPTGSKLYSAQMMAKMMY
jgi:hypothetical protein